MKHSPKHRRIRAVFPNGENKRGYRVVFIMHNPNPFAIPHWLTKWSGNVTFSNVGLLTERR
jgi:hypothetical protein